jgi:Uma2 family endonuclease
MVELGMFQDERIELLRGVLVPMSPIGPPHSDTIDRLNRLLILSLEGRARVRCQNPYAALDDSEPEPDFSVVPLGDYHLKHPERADLVIEVADSSLSRDRGVKLHIYAENGVPEYWIVNVKDRRIEVHTDPSPEGYRTRRVVEPGETLLPARFADVVFRADDILR